MNKIMKTEPAVFAVGDTYQIMVPVTCPVLMWVRVGDECYYDDSNGIIRSAVSMHRMSVPMDELDREKKYTICWRKIIERKPYFTETEDVEEAEFEFIPVSGEEISAYHIADAHNMVEAPVAAAKAFEKENGKIDFFILNGDIPDHSGAIENFDNIYEITAQITHGKIPAVFSRGNHDTRGIYAENIAEYTPCENGNSFYSFRLGKLWGIVMDCGEDKSDTNEEYGNTVCCHAFRKRETAYLKNIIKHAAEEYNAPDTEHKIVIVHNPFTWRWDDKKFEIEHEIFAEWAKLLKENVKPDLMLCGHMHSLGVYEPGCDRDLHGQPCTMVLGSMPKNIGTENEYYVGAGYVFKKDKIEVVFTDSKSKILEKHTIKK